MPFPVPAAMQYPWDKPLVRHLSQLMDTSTGGINAWATRPTTGVDGNTLGTDHEGYTGYNTNTGKLERWDGSQWEEIASGLGQWDDTSKPANPEEGDVGYNSDIPGLEFYDGSQWQPISGGSTCDWANLTELRGDTTLTRADKQCYYVATDNAGSWTLTLPSNPQVGDEINIQGDESLTSANLYINPNGNKFQGEDIESESPVTLGSYNISARLVYKDTESGWVSHPYIPNPGETIDPETVAGSGGPGGVSDDELWFWGDATDATTITESSGKVSSWASKIGTVSFVQSDSSYQPDYLTSGGVNNGPGIRFPGGTSFQRLDSNDSPDLTNATVICVIKPNIVNGHHRFVLQRGNTTDYWDGQSASISVMIDDRYKTNTARITMPDTHGGWLHYADNYITSGQDTVLEYTRNPNQLKNWIYTNTTSYSSINPTDIIDPQIMRIGCYSTRVNPRYAHYYQYDGYITELIIYTRELSTSELSTINTYLISKYNL